MTQLALEKFLRSNSDWEKQLTEPPYNLAVKRDGDYVIFKYNQFSSDLSFEVCREARGIIFHEPDRKPVCVPFFKFFNYGDPRQAEIDWSSDVITTEKMDGSLMKMWYHNDKWHLSTNNTIDAYKTKAGENDKTFGMLFEESLGVSMKELTDSMNTNTVYMFELLHPEIVNVVDYSNAKKVYLLAQRDMTDYRETFDLDDLPGTYRPQLYHLADIKDVLDAVNVMNESHEGVVVCDSHFNRVKVKSPFIL